MCPSVKEKVIIILTELILEEGDDITIVSYGSTLNIVHTVAKEIKKFNINCEVIDLQSLIPFDISKNIIKSIKKTNRLMIIDEDVPGGASSYILQELLNNQNLNVELNFKIKEISDIVDLNNLLLKIANW